jgi:outer membrane protein assembly factor BamB
MRLLALITCLVCLLGCKEATRQKTNAVIATNNGDLYHIDIKNNRLLWKIDGNENTHHLTYFTVNDSSIFRAYSDKRVVELEKDTGRIKWEYSDSLSPNHSVYGYDFDDVGHFLFSQYPIIHKNAFIFANTKGEIKSVDINTKKVNWTHQISQPIYHSPLMLNGKLLVNKNHYLAYVNPDTGKKQESLGFESPLVTEPIIEQGLIYVVDEDETIFCLDKDLAIVWKNDKGLAEDVFAVSKNAIVSGRENIARFDKKTGEVKWQLMLPKQNTKVSIDTKQADGSIFSVGPADDDLQSLDIFDDEVFASTPHYLLKIDLDSGKVLKKHYFLDKEIVGDIKFYDGDIYYLGRNGHLYKMDEHFKQESIVYKNLHNTAQPAIDEAYIALY